MSGEILLLIMSTPTLCLPRIDPELPSNSRKHLVAPLPGDNEANTSSTVIFNTNEQKTATIGKVPRVSKMSSFYGAHDLNTSQETRTNSLKKTKKQLKESFRVPTVYRIGSLHLSEGVSLSLYVKKY